MQKRIYCEMYCDMSFPQLFNSLPRGNSHGHFSVETSSDTLLPFPSLSQVFVAAVLATTLRG